MFSRFLLIFILLPLADLVLIWMLLKLNIGITILWIVISGIAGWWYVRRQGLQVLDEIRASVQDNKIPTDILVEGGIVLFAGGLLITPGLLTDIFGFSMLIRPCRRWYRKRLLAWMKSKVKVSTFTMQGGGQPSSDPNVMDAEFTRKSTSSTSELDPEDPVIVKPANISSKNS